MTLDARDRRRMTREDHDILPRTHIPYTSCTVSTGGEQDVERWVDVERVDTREMTVVLSNHAICFQVPTNATLALINVRARAGWTYHLTILSSAHENRYGCRFETANPRTVEM